MPKATYQTIIETIARTKSSPVTVFADFCRMAACCLACQTREDEYLEVAGRYSKDQLTKISEAFASLVIEMEKAPFTDILGPYYMEISSNSSKKGNGEFYTPQEISRLLAKITVHAGSIIEKGLPITVNEPSCGSGNIVLAVAEDFAPGHVDLLRVTAQDISPIAADMCYINTTLWGIPAHVIWGDTLRQTVNKSWKNIHWHRVGEDSRLRSLRLLHLVSGIGSKTSESEPAINFPANKTEQLSFSF